MRRTRFDRSECPIARTVDLVGDWWTPLILREVFTGRTRFEAIAESLEISRAVLSTRLKRLEAEGVVERVCYEERPPRYEYQLTAKGQDLRPVLLAMWNFGTAHLFADDEEVPLLRGA